MNTKNRNLFIISVLILAGAGMAALGVITGAIAAPGAAPAGAIQAAPMAPLPEATCTLVDTTRTCYLWALSGSLSLPGGVNVPVWGFAGSASGPALVPGPLIRANAGETLEIVLHNQIPDETIALALPGQEMIPDLVGVASTSTSTISTTLAVNGTFLYEAGLTPGGARQVAMGLFGPLVVEPTPLADQEVVLVFSELDPAFNINPRNYSMFHFRPKYWLINGQAYPDTGFIEVAAGSSVLLRYLNAGVQHRTIGLLGLDQQILASNGDELVAARGAIAEPLAPGETKEALVRLPAAASTGTLYPLYNASLHQHNNNQRLADGRAAFGGMLTFLQVTGGTDPGAAGPVASNVTVLPQKTNGTVDVTLSATLQDVDGVAAYEYYVDQPGTLTGMVSLSEPFLTVVNLTEIFNTTQVNSLGHGEHIFYIRGQDSGDIWGALGSATMYLDQAGPSISGLNMNPNPTNGSLAVALSGTADDRANGNSLITAAEYSLNGGTTWLPMTLSVSGTSVKALTATILAADVANLGEGTHPVMVRALDELGNWTDPAATITLTVDLTGPAVPATNLSQTMLDFTQPNVPPTVRLTATISDALSTLVNAEGFIGTVGAPGTGFALYPSDGLFDEPVEDVYYEFPSSVFASYLSGDYQVYVLGKDKASNWSTVPGSATITIVSGVIDTAGPYVSNLALDPNPTGGATTVTLTALATDVNLMSNIVGAEYWIGTKKNAAHVAMSATDGAFDSPSEWVQATISIANNMKAGTYLISVRAMDAAGNWGPVQTIGLIVD